MKGMDIMEKEFEYVETPFGTTRVPNEFNSKIAGISFTNQYADDEFETIVDKNDFIMNQIMEGDELILVPKTATWVNRITKKVESDENAVAIYYDGKKIGWIQQQKTQLASKLSYLMQNGFNVKCYVENISGGTPDKKNIGMNIKIVIG